jgi:hypothetical protein
MLMLQCRLESRICIKECHAAIEWQPNWAFILCLPTTLDRSRSSCHAEHAIVYAKCVVDHRLDGNLRSWFKWRNRVYTHHPLRVGSGV